VCDSSGTALGAVLSPRQWPCFTTAVRVGEFDRIVDLPRTDSNIQFTRIK
jgi:hypothetical protein